MTTSSRESYHGNLFTRLPCAAVQGFILLCGAFAVLIHLLHGAARRVARLRIRRA